MSNDRTDPRWEERLCTGMDPCEEETVNRTTPKTRKPSSRKKGTSEAGVGAALIIIFMCFCIYGLYFTPDDIRKRNERKERDRQEAIERQELLARINAALEYSWIPEQKVEPDSTASQPQNEVEPRPMDESWYRRTGSVSQSISSPSPVTKEKHTPYQQGYRDGYDEGYDDRIQRMGFGYKYDSDGESEEYQKGYDKGYRDGYADGYEDYEAFGDDEL